MALVAIFEALEANLTHIGNTILLLIELAVAYLSTFVESFPSFQHGYWQKYLFLCRFSTASGQPHTAGGAYVPL